MVDMTSRELWPFEACIHDSIYHDKDGYAMATRIEALGIVTRDKKKSHSIQ